MTTTAGQPEPIRIAVRTIDPEPPEGVPVKVLIVRPPSAIWRALLAGLFGRARRPTRIRKTAGFLLTPHSAPTPTRRRRPAGPARPTHRRAERHDPRVA